MMHIKTVVQIFTLFALLLAGTFPLSAELVGHFSVRFHGKSTLHGFSGTAEGEEFSIDAHNAYIPLRVKVLKMTTDLKARDTNMYEMFAAKDHPFILGRVKREDLQLACRGMLKSFPLELTIREQQKTVPIQVHALQTVEGKQHLHSQTMVQLEDFHLKPPSVAFGMIRVAPAVNVTIEWILEE